MKEIRFRAWDGENMIYSVAVMNGTAYTIGEDGSLYRLTNYRKIAKPIPLQYIGLKDKNGVDIYEGDIVTYSDGISRFLNVIVYQEDSAMFILDSFRHEQIPKIIEVIGNIYQNKELLEETAT